MIYQPALMINTIMSDSRTTTYNNKPDALRFEQSCYWNLTYKLDNVIEWLLIGLLAFMPLVFGVVHAWSQQVVVVVSGTIVLCFLLKLFLQRQTPLLWTLAYIPLSAFIILAVFQLSPLPSRLAEIISPGTVTLRNELLGDLPNAKEILRSITISFYPHATRSDLRIILALAGLFFVVLNYYNEPQKIKRLLAAITIIGAAVAVLALAQNIFGNGKIYWFVSSNNTDAHSGPFVNHCNYGQFMNLSIAAAIGLLMIILHETFGGKKLTLPMLLEQLFCRKTIKMWLIVAAIGICLTTIFTSLTRGGIISMLFAMGLVTLLLSSKRQLRSHGWMMVVAAMLAFICVLYTGFDAVFDRMASLRDIRQAGAYRMQILKDITAISHKFPLLGTGLGTHSTVYPMFDRTNSTALAAYAENDYAQTIEETGMVGFCLLAVFGACICSGCIKAIRKNKLPIGSAIYGLIFGIVAILIQSLSDFGQHLPANAFLSVIFCALITALAKRGTNEEGRGIKYSARSKILYPVSICLAGAVFVWIYAGANSSRLAESSWNKVRTIEKNLAKTNWQGSEVVYGELLKYARTALEYEPENVKYSYWLNVYRWRSINHSANPKVNDITTYNDSVPEIRDIVEQLHKVCISCPTYGPAYTLAGELEKFVLNDSAGSDKIKKGYRLAPGDAISCYIAGYLDLVEGKYEDCTSKLNRAASLDDRLFKNVAAIYLEYLSRPDLVVLLAGDNISRLNYLVGVFSEAQYEDLANQCRTRMQKILQQQCSTPDAPAQILALLAEIYGRQKEYDKAIDCYQRALALDYSQLKWRIELAKTLAAANSLPEALHEAKICLRIYPCSKEAQKLAEDLSVLPAAWDNVTRLR
jgi:hypothetical protein